MLIDSDYLSKYDCFLRISLHLPSRLAIERQLCYMIHMYMTLPDILRALSHLKMRENEETDEDHRLIMLRSTAAFAETDWRVWWWYETRRFPSGTKPAWPEWRAQASLLE